VNKSPFNNNPSVKCRVIAIRTWDVKLTPAPERPVHYRRMIMVVTPRVSRVHPVNGKKWRWFPWLPTH
jgi:hypothetical protein